MAKLSIKNREAKRTKTVEKFAAKRAALKAKILAANSRLFENHEAAPEVGHVLEKLFYDSPNRIKK